MKRIGLVGAGGHARVIRDMIAAQEDMKLIALFDDKYEASWEEQGIQHGPISSIFKYVHELDVKLVIAVGNNTIRKKITDRLQLSIESYATIIHPSAIISPSASIGRGTVIMPYVVVNADAVIGNHVILNTASVVEHDNQVGCYAHISPNATLTGNVTIGTGTQIGAGTALIPGVTIGEWSVIGAGSTVIRDVPPNCTAVGSPAKVIKM